ncbi:MAG: FAD binding domain-containing protein [Bacillota bacterium]|nr:FAD binding domain-containing protein [Bacillota bacterium]
MKFAYYKAESVQEAMAMLGEFGDKGKIVAGGTDLLVGIQHGKYAAPEALVDISFIDELSQLNAQNGDGLSIGATVTHGAVCKAPNIFEKFPALVEACSQLGSPQVRNLATVGGNICNAAPSAETAPALVVLKAMARIAGPSGERQIELNEFFLGPSRTDIKQGEMLVNLQLSEPAQGSGNAYFRLSPRNALDIAIVNVAAYVKLNKDYAFEDVCICMGAVAPTPLRASIAEKAMFGETFSEKLIREAGQLAKTHSVPITDVRASAEYRKEMVAVLTERALTKAYERAKLNM